MSDGRARARPAAALVDALRARLAGCMNTNVRSFGEQNGGELNQAGWV